MAKKLKILAKNSSLMDVTIQYGKEKIKFNLFEELQIDEAKINTELKDQPSFYGFLSLLMVRLKRSMDDKKAILDKITKDLFIEYKTDIDKTTGRPYSNDMAEALVVQEEGYQNSLKDYQKAEEDFSSIKACVDSFTQRSHLVQSLSANVRKVNN